MLVACLCADWCGACREYKPLFDALAAKFPQIQFLWVDVEDQADLIDPIEVENFPTILIANAASPFFFGTVLPHIETLERLIQDKMIHGKPLPVAQDDIYKLAKTLIAKQYPNQR